MLLPDEVSREKAAVTELLSVAVNDVIKTVSLGDNVVIYGPEPAGLYLTQVAKWLASLVITVDPIQERRELSLKLSCNFAVHPNDLNDILRREKIDVDVVFDSTPGVRGIIADAVEIIRPSGKICVFGPHHEEEKRLNLPLWQSKVDMIKIASNWQNLNVRRETGRLTLKLVKNKKVSARAMITHILPLEELPDAMRLIEKEPEKVVKALVRLG